MSDMPVEIISIKKLAAEYTPEISSLDDTINEMIDNHLKESNKDAQSKFRDKMMQLSDIIDKRMESIHGLDEISNARYGELAWMKDIIKSIMGAQCTEEPEEV